MISSIGQNCRWSHALDEPYDNYKLQLLNHVPPIAWRGPRNVTIKQVITFTRLRRTYLMRSYVSLMTPMVIWSSKYVEYNRQKLVITSGVAYECEHNQKLWYGMNTHACKRHVMHMTLTKMVLCRLTTPSHSNISAIHSVFPHDKNNLSCEKRWW